MVFVMIRPLGARAVVKPLEAEEKSAGGIILPETAQERPREGKVVAVGTAGLYVEDYDEGESAVNEGDIVIYASFGGTEVRIDGEDYLIINEEDILAVRDM
jgi:chaperonin GroES